MMLDKVALLCMFADADLRKLPEVLAATVGTETEVLYLRLSNRIPVAFRNMIAKTIRNYLKLRVDVKSVTDTQIRYVYGFHAWVQKQRMKGVGDD